MGTDSAGDEVGSEVVESADHLGPARELGRLLAPQTGLNQDAIADAVAGAERTRGGQLRLLWSLQRPVR
ncbi:hypothetical protein ACF07F_15770 [Streptomyces sp. NPDC015237]|uniref:hypothetical protein n=1 Tax=Streptomyces sp. NPDC015237 TaxID=3364949 RepID=UPI0036FB3271